MKDIFDEIEKSVKNYRPGPGAASAAASLGCTAAKAAVAFAVANPVTTIAVGAAIITCAVVLDD